MADIYRAGYVLAMRLLQSGLSLDDEERNAVASFALRRAPSTDGRISGRSVTVPVVHLNGTSRAQLEAQCSDAVHALDAALVALEAAAPNGRDYYPLGPTAERVAQEEHAYRILRVRNVRAEIETIWTAIVDADLTSKQEGR